MPTVLPIGNFSHYVGVDPGFSGGIVSMNAKGTSMKVWDMPVTKVEKARRREFDMDGLYTIFDYVAGLKKPVVAIEWPTTRPGEGAERCERFGRGKGILHAFAYLLDLKYVMIPPNLWKGRLGLPGKTDANANRIAAGLFDAYYPGHSKLIRGPRGGIKDGRCDAALIAHFLRMREAGSLREVVKKFGKDSPQAWALMLGAGPKRRR